MDEEKVEGTEETTEAPAEGKAKKAKKPKKEVDIKGMTDKAKKGVLDIKGKIETLCKEKPGTAKLIMMALFVAMVVLAGMGGTNFLMIIMMAVVAAIGIVCVNATFSVLADDGAEEEKAE